MHNNTRELINTASTALTSLLWQLLSWQSLRPLAQWL